MVKLDMFSGKKKSDADREEAFSPFIVYRTIGSGRGERFGVGGMDKMGTSADCVDYRHRALVLIAVLSGNGIYVDESGCRWPVSPGCTVIRFKNRTHSLFINPASGWKELFLELGDTLASVLEFTGAVDPAHPVIGGQVMSDATIERFKLLGSKFRESADSALVVLLPEVLELALLMTGVGAVPDAGEEPLCLLEAACRMLGDFSRDCDLQSLCRRHGVGYENFRKLFKARFGLAPHQYRLRRRIDAACALLLHPDLTVQEIASRLGYSSPYEFSAQFKRYLGVSPSLWRPRRQAASDAIRSSTSR